MTRAPRSLSSGYGMPPGGRFQEWEWERKLDNCGQEKVELVTAPNVVFTPQQFQTLVNIGKPNLVLSHLVHAFFPRCILVNSSCRDTASTADGRRLLPLKAIQAVEGLMRQHHQKNAVPMSETELNRVINSCCTNARRPAIGA
ncbi:uncharacterized protein LOC144691243 [Cetorhinus maximus]